MKQLSPADLQAYMQQNSIPGEFLYLDIPTPTVETAARAVGTQPENIVKSILFLVDNQPVLAITCGNHHVDRRPIARKFGVGRKRVKLATPEDVLQLAGFEVGAMPPFGHLRPIPTLIDRRVMEHNPVYAGGGAENALIRLNPGDIQKATGAQTMDLWAASDED